jgi:DNA polymerase-3 subunit delta'
MERLQGAFYMIDETPESDKTDGCPHPRKTLNLFGHKKAQTEILDALKNEKIHHAWLVCGSKGIGKATLVWKMARTLLTMDPLATISNHSNSPTNLNVAIEHPIYKRTLALTEPKLHLLRRNWDPKTERFRQSITIEDIRALKGFFNLSSTDDGRRVVIIDSADDLQTAGANALLKVLEEPPAKTTILIVSHNPSRLLPTIKSRCRILNLKPLGYKDLQQGIAQVLEMDNKINDSISELANGSIGNAMHLLNNRGIETYESLCQLFGLSPSFDRPKAIELTSELTRKNSEQNFDILISMLNIFINRLALTGAGAPPQVEVVQSEFNILNKLSPNLSSAKIWSELGQNILNNAIKAKTVNLEPSSVILDLFLKFDNIISKIHNK